MNTKCIICSSNAQFVEEIRFVDIVGLVSEYHPNICICNNCQIIYVSNPIPEEDLMRYYKELSKYEGENSTGIVGSDLLKMAERQARFILGKVKDVKTVLEVGSSTGFNLNAFKQKGFSVYGIEPSFRNQRFAKDNYGINLFLGSFDNYFDSESKCSHDLVIVSHVLEHLHDPANFIKQLKEVNRNYVYIEVPSFEIQLVDEPYGIFFYEHIFYFTIDSLSHLMASHGYVGIKIQIEYNVDGEFPHFPVICSLWEKSDNGKHVPSMYSSHTLLREYLNQSYEKFEKFKEKIDAIDANAKLAIWGTGSHTSRLLGMTNLAHKNIVKFYDSDPKKQGFTMLGKSITAFNADDINNKFVDTILVSTRCGEESIRDFLSYQPFDIKLVTFYEE